jgi:ArsR family transcriptional regulator
MIQEVTAKFFRGLGDPLRLRILEELLEGELCVSDLVARTGLPQGRVSHHLGCLRWCGYVSTRKEGRYVYYAVTDLRVRQLVELAHDIVAKNAEHILECVRIGR